MAQDTQDINLARKLRPTNFDQIIGQTISIQLLKNSLAQNKFFPVYLLSGQRGCGKTSTARVFAAAINCQNLTQFQSDQSVIVPCAVCSSCVSTRQGNHPDFIEIDAASNTGVDNVRSILETCSYLPLLGRKKIYLIDEAHMLSKSAFNAFLKMLEEPPASVIFMLATTEAIKIPETVRSRCFQLSFKSLPPEEMKSYVASVCKQEAIAIDQAALDIVMHEVDGCMRDALNLLEQVRFLGQVDEAKILATLGLVSKQQLYALFEFVVKAQPQEVLQQLMAMNFVRLSPTLLWNNLIQLCRSLVWKKYGVTSTAIFAAYDLEKIEAVAAACSSDRLHEIMQLFWSQEEFFLKTPQKHLFLEYLLVSLADGSYAKLGNKVQAVPVVQNHAAQNSGLKKGTSEVTKSVTASVQVVVPVAKPEPVMQESAPKVLTVSSSSAPVIKNEVFESLVIEIDQLKDRLLSAIFTQAQFLGIDAERGFLRLGVTTVSSFYQDKLRETQSLWQPLLRKTFPNCNDFSMESLQKNTNPTAGGRPSAQSGQRPVASFKSSSSVNSGPDITDTQKWAQANLLTQQFSGKLEVVKEESDQ